MNASKGHGFFYLHEPHPIITAHKLWTRLNTSEKAAVLANCGQGVGDTWAETAPEEGKPDGANAVISRSQTSPWRTLIHDRVRDSVARQLR